MKKKPRLDASSIRVVATDTDDGLMIKVRHALPGLLRDFSRQIGEAEWSLMERRIRHTGMKSDRAERAKFIRDTSAEYLHDLTPAQKQEIALQICAELKTRRDELARQQGGGTAPV